MNSLWSIKNNNRHTVYFGSGSANLSLYIYNFMEWGHFYSMYSGSTIGWTGYNVFKKKGGGYYFVMVLIIKTKTLLPERNMFDKSDTF